jgi:hypothetical protein
MYLHIVELLSKRSSTFAFARREFQIPDNTQRITDVASRCTSHRTYRCSCSCFAAGPAPPRRARRASNGGDDGGDARGSTTTTVDARILPMPNSRMTRETLLPPPSLEFSQGPPSRRGRKEAEEEEEAPLAPPAGCRDASRRAATASCPLGAPPPLVR